MKDKLFRLISADAHKHKGIFADVSQPGQCSFDLRLTRRRPSLNGQRTDTRISVVSFEVSS